MVLLYILLTFQQMEEDMEVTYIMHQHVARFGWNTLFNHSLTLIDPHPTSGNEVEIVFL